LIIPPPITNFAPFSSLSAARLYMILDYFPFESEIKPNGEISLIGLNLMPKIDFASKCNFSHEIINIEL